MKIILGADHAGFEMKEKIKKHLVLKGHAVEDVGAIEYNHDDDYPVFAKKVAKRVLKTKSKGIVVCGSGIGVSIAANKVKGIRAAHVFDELGAKMSRMHNNANVLALRGWKFPVKKALHLVDVWLTTPFSRQAKHKRRVEQL